VLDCFAKPIFPGHSNYSASSVEIVCNFPFKIVSFALQLVLANHGQQKP